MRAQWTAIQIFSGERAARLKTYLGVAQATARGDLVGGLCSAVVGIAYGLTFANLIFSGALKPWNDYGLAATFITMSVCAIAMSGRSSLPFVIAGPDGATAAITASLVSALIAELDRIGQPDDLLAPTMILIAFSTGITGLVLFGIATFRGSNIIRYIPYPVVGGFLAATGWLMINGGIRIAADRSLGISLLETANRVPQLKVLASIGMATMMTLMQRAWKSHYAMPSALLGGVLVGHLVLLSLGSNLSEAQMEGWFLRPPRLTGLATTWDLRDLKLFPWASLPLLAGDILGIAFVTVLTMLLNTISVELITRQDVDLERELKTIGLANIVSAVSGGYVGCTSLSRTLLNHALGGESRLSGLIVALISGGLLLAGSEVVGYAPRFVLGGLMLYLGGGMLHKWLIGSVRLISKLDYVLLLIVAIAILNWGFIAGILAGVLIGCVTFAYSASQTETVKFRFDGAQYMSSLDRGPEELAILIEQSDEIQGFVLQGYLFFGSANRLYEQVKKLIEDHPTCRFLVFDFTLVNGVDSSALQSFLQIRQIAEGRNVRLALVRPPSALRRPAAQIVRANDIVDDSLDHALEACENEVIARRLQDNDEEGDLTAWLTEALGCPQLAARLAERCVRQEVPAGKVIAVQGASADSMHFILKGRVGIMIGLELGRETRVRSLGRHTTVGEMGLLTGGLRSATVRAETESVVYRLDETVFHLIKHTEPDLSHALLSYLFCVMSQRLRMTSNIAAVLRH
jgi:SulP family sulfate permease